MYFGAPFIFCDMSEVNTITNLVEFNCMFGTDVGLIKVMEKYYGESDFLDLYYSTENSLKNKLLWRENWNPLTIMLKKDYLDSANDLYKEAMDKYEEEIYAMSPFTDVIRFMNFVQKNNDWKIRTTVNCKNDLQKQRVKQTSELFLTTLDEFDMREYTTLFINEIENIATYRSLGGKYIFISNYRFNLDKNWRLKPCIFREGGYNKVRMVDPYKGLTVPIDKGEM